MAAWRCSSTPPRPRTAVDAFTHHDDRPREYAYDRMSKVGRLDLAWDEAVKRGWLVVSMKQDFKTVFAFEKSTNHE